MKTYESLKAVGKAGDATAARNVMLTNLVRQSGDTFFGKAFQLTGNSEQASELVQDGLYRVLRAWKSYDASKSLDAWLMRIMCNAFYDTCRSSRRGRLLSLDAGLPDETDRRNWVEVLSDRSASVIERLASQDLVARALRALPAKHKAVLILCMEGLGSVEISRRLGVPIGTVRTRIFRARKTLRTFLGKVGPSES